MSMMHALLPARGIHARAHTQAGIRRKGERGGGGGAHARRVSYYLYYIIISIILLGARDSANSDSFRNFRCEQRRGFEEQSKHANFRREDTQVSAKQKHKLQQSNNVNFSRINT